MAGEVTYSSYLDLERVLSAQKPASDAHDELLFIVVHQASELWLKLCLHELAAARALIAADDVRQSFKVLERVSRTLTQLIGAWDVLSTMTPHDYAQVRPHLGRSSGFQSAQYRLLEFILGARNPDMVAMHQAAPGMAAALREEMARPSLYDEAVRLLERRGFAVGCAVAARDPGRPYVAASEVEAAWAAVYRAPEDNWELYELAEKLLDIEIQVQRWRFGHLKTVERIIGFKRGTGGTPGVPYLREVLDQVFFPELISVRKVL